MAEEKTGTLAVQLPGVDFGLLAKQIVAEKVAEGLFKSEAIVQGLIAEALTHKVNSEGTASRSYDRDSMTWLEYTVRQLLKDAVVGEVKKQVANIQPKLERAVSKALKDSADLGAGILVADFFERIKSTYGPSIEVTFKAPKRDR